MSMILHIDTAGTVASVMLADNADVLGVMENKQQHEHASFLHPAIEKLLKGSGLSLPGIEAVAVANGPGSYTGLRVGLAAAKGICYALKKPLICINNLDLLAHSARSLQNEQVINYVPMIDARRMEVFTAVYDKNGKNKIFSHAQILNENSFDEQLKEGPTIFCGNGVDKWKKICQHPNALYSIQYDLSQAFATLSYDAFMTKSFADLAYVEPFYVKEFFSGNS